MSSAQIPISYGEVLYVALSHVLDYLEEHGEYPHGMAANIRVVLASYDHDRTKLLQSRGISEVAVKRYTAQSAEGLAKWLDSKALRDENSTEHFQEWARELGLE
ncbi:hypothetical protein [Mycobacteroides abscessus]|uniref:hypothetical protein n=1 Tax=Mycobacteroides abscessus TaxID=36809 RepID=UPI0005DBD762|nr:hypothetical protein [Mycobacteroides abscessus]QSM02350.1 hypothetical protein PROPHIGD86-1_76 [Mycobacterium phage prophi86-1]WJJ55480.1 hypothetical protein PROPHIT492_74 [Mycobacterium phage prophiT49-2]MBN7458615.1 hypothetical protein [Mycobacteroides abscessus subsp. abscessus]MDB2213888.1 hypothetical protein [Mycobacteroides abscessus subsp. massiliense]CPS10133.1 Uncharacterised protein [Mycobacteroides abscessus]